MEETSIRDVTGVYAKDMTLKDYRMTGLYLNTANTERGSIMEGFTSDSKLERVADLIKFHHERMTNRHV